MCRELWMMICFGRLLIPELLGFCLLDARPCDTRYVCMYLWLWVNHGNKNLHWSDSTTLSTSDAREVPCQWDEGVVICLVVIIQITKTINLIVPTPPLRLDPGEDMEYRIFPPGVPKSVCHVTRIYVLFTCNLQPVLTNDSVAKLRYLEWSPASAISINTVWAKVIKLCFSPLMIRVAWMPFGTAFKPTSFLCCHKLPLLYCVI